VLQINAKSGFTGDFAHCFRLACPNLDERCTLGA
jgi:hypothetical protein